MSLWLVVNVCKTNGTNLIKVQFYNEMCPIVSSAMTDTEQFLWQFSWKTSFWTELNTPKMIILTQHPRNQLESCLVLAATLDAIGRISL